MEPLRNLPPGIASPPSDLSPWLLLFVLLAVAFMVVWVVLWNHRLQRRVEERSRRLADSEAFLERIFLQSPYGMWVADAEGTMVMMNDACERLFGIGRREDVIGRYNVFKDNVVQDLNLLDDVRRAFHGETVTVTDTYDPGKVRGFDLPSKPLFLRTTFTPIMGRSGNVNHVLVLHEDITERSRAERQLRDRSQKVWALLEAYSDLTSTLDPQEVLSRVSRLAVKALPSAKFGGFFLYEPETDSLHMVHAIGFRDISPDLTLPRGSGIAGRVFDEGKAVHLPDPEAVATTASGLPREQRAVWDTLCGGEEPQAALGVPLMARNRCIGVLVLITTDPQKRFTEYDAKLLEAFADHAAAAIDNAYLYEALVRKSSELEEVNRRLHGALEELKVLDEMKTNLLSNVSHELRTPLIAIMGYTDLMLKERLGPITAEQRNRLEISLRNAQRLSKRIEDLLNFSRSEMGEMVLDLSQFDLSELLEEAVESVRNQAEERGVALSVDLPDDDLTIKGDRDKILQVFTNLLDNAVKFNKKGGSVEVHAKPIGKGLARVNISDTGIGIPEDAQERIFDRFYQVDASTARPYGGTGIGLALVRSIVNMHGGRVRVRSKPGEGATFTVSLPVYDSERDSGRYRLPAEGRATRAEGAASPASPD